MNKCFFVGNLTKDPKKSIAQSGVHVSSFSIAVNEGYGDKKTTQYVNLVAFNKMAEICNKYLVKGSKILVEAKVNHRSYEVNGEKKYTTDFIIQNMEMLGSKNSNTNATPSPATDFGTPINPNEEDIPF